LLTFVRMKKIDVSVSNDLFSDNRVNKTCLSLQKLGFDVRLIGRMRKNSPSMSRPYRFCRMRLLFDKEIWFYAELNIRLFFKLLFSRQDALWANDLDTLPANFLVSKLKRKPLVFDSHEHFTQVPELKENPTARKVWIMVERCCVPRVNRVVTVCNTIKNYFKETYGTTAVVVRNIPNKAQQAAPKIFPEEDTLVWQGAINVERGLENLLEAMPYINAKLYIAGDGDIKEKLIKEAQRLHLENKVFFTGRLTFDEMMERTRKATIGISIDQPTNKNYASSLPNKIFEYINASLPILASPLQEIKPIIENYGVGECISDITPKNLADTINRMLQDKEKLTVYSDNCRKAQEELNWENEEKKIEQIFSQLFKS